MELSPQVRVMVTMCLAAAVAVVVQVWYLKIMELLRDL